MAVLDIVLWSLVRPTRVTVSRHCNADPSEECLGTGVLVNCTDVCLFQRERERERESYQVLLSYFI